MELEKSTIILTMALAITSIICGVSFAIYVLYYVFKDNRKRICHTLLHL